MNSSAALDSSHITVIPRIDFASLLLKKKVIFTHRNAK